MPCGVVRTVLESLRDIECSAATGVAPSVPGSVRLPPPKLDEHGAEIRARGWAVVSARSADAVRYIGNKTRLLPFLMSTIDRLELSPKTAHDAFSGTAAVGRALKEAGWRVTSSDLMTYSYVFQRAYVVAQRSPSFAALRAGDPELRRAHAIARRSGNPSPATGRSGAMSEFLTRWIDPERGFIGSHFAPAGGRMYFTQENADRIDAIRRRLHEWWSSGLIQDDAYYVLAGRADRRCGSRREHSRSVRRVHQALAGERAACR